MDSLLQSPMLVELQWVHDCFCIDSVQQVHQGRISLVSPIAHGKGFTTGLYEIDSGENAKVFVNHLRGHRLVRQVDVVESDENKALIYVRSKPDSLMIETIAKTGCVPLEPSMTKNGFDSSSVYVPNEQALRELHSTLKDNYDVKLLTKKYLHFGESRKAAYFGTKELLAFKTLTNRLSARQLEVLAYASRKGYFDTPKKVSIEEIASNLGLKQATASEHLRKAQAKILPFMAELMQNIK